MGKPSPPKLRIDVSLSGRTLTLANVSGAKPIELLRANVVTGCEDSGTPAGAYVVGKWVKDKTNAKHGPKPWSQDPWGNPYGPYFLPLNDAKTGKYTTYGIHGTRGPMAGGMEKPPLPQSFMSFFLGDEQARFLYCSHGCIRLSNQNIKKLFDLTTQPELAGVQISVVVK
jgi:lipoprotein-anchoring transpeptidase ErfK/SrfK